MTDLPRPRYAVSSYAYCTGTDDLTEKTVQSPGRPSDGGK